MLIDSHCHLNYKGLVEEQGAVLDRARDSGVTAMLNISTRESEWRDIVATAERERDVWASIGIHPHEADAHPDVDLGKLVEEAAHPRVIAIGETGLDYYYDHSDRERQRQSFRTHIHAARQTGLPIIVHTRDAEDDTAEIMAEEMEQGAYSGVIHCFTASAAFAQQALALGLYIYRFPASSLSRTPRICRKRLQNCRQIACSWKLMHPSWHRFRIVEKPASRPSLPIPPAISPGYATRNMASFANPPVAISTSSSPRRGPECGPETHDIRMRDFDRRAADRQRLGRLRP